MAKIISINAVTGEVSERQLSTDELSQMYQPETADHIRQIRDNILATVVDPLVSNPLRWADLTADQQQAWADYRRALLDVPQQAGFPQNVSWPVKPE